MNDVKYKELITKLIQRTIAKKAIWNNTSRESEFILNFQSGSITIDSWTNESNGRDCIDFVIRNDKGIIIFSRFFDTIENFEDFNFLFNLYNTARESYFKTDETVDDIFKELDSEKTIGVDIENEQDDLPW